MLRMDNFQWMKVKHEGSQLRGSANFGSTLVNSKLIIFGGIQENLFPYNETYIIELDQNRVEEMVQRDKDDEERKRFNIEFRL